MQGSGFQVSGFRLFPGKQNSPYPPVLITLYVSSVVAFSLDIVLTKEHHIDARTDIWLTAASSEVLLASDGSW